MPQELKAILKTAVETSWAREVAWLRTLVAFPSLRGQEAPCQDWIAGEFSRRGWSVDRYTLAEIDMSHLPGFSPIAAPRNEPERTQCRVMWTSFRRVP